MKKPAAAPFQKHVHPSSKKMQEMAKSAPDMMSAKLDPSKHIPHMMKCADKKGT